MKRVQAACIFQTLCFQQKEDLNLSGEQLLKLNRTELEGYIKKLDEQKLRYRITDQQELENGSIVIRVRKQYNQTAEVQEYFEL